MLGTSKRPIPTDIPDPRTDPRVSEATERLTVLQRASNADAEARAALAVASHLRRTGTAALDDATARWDLTTSAITEEIGRIDERSEIRRREITLVRREVEQTTAAAIQRVVASIQVPVAVELLNGLTPQNICERRERLIAFLKRNAEKGVLTGYLLRLRSRFDATAHALDALGAAANDPAARRVEL